MKKVLNTVAPALMGVFLIGSFVSCSPSNRDIDAASLVNLAYHQSTPLWSKDGSKIIFSRISSGLFVVEADGSRLWSLPPDAPLGTRLSPGNFSHAVSPDGSRVAYAMVDKSDFSADIVTSAIDGSDRRRLSNNNSVDANPSWSPDGTQIVFYSDRAGSPGNPTLHLFIMDSDGSDVRQLIPELPIFGTPHPPVWSPDGSRIAFVANREDRVKRGEDVVIVERTSVHTVRPDGSGVVELWETVSNPGWSPDGSRIAFIKKENETQKLYTMNPDGGDQRELWSFTTDVRWYGIVSWSPDSLEILVGPRSGGRGDAFVVSADGSGARTIARFTTLTYKEGPNGAAWSPDGSRIAFHIKSNDSDVVLYTTARDGSDKRVLVRGDDDRLVAVGSDWRDVSDDIAACSSGKIVSKPDENPGLVKDCETLLEIRDALAGDAILDWIVDIPIKDWEGVRIEGSPPRVVRLRIVGLDPAPLNGFIPEGLSRFNELAVLNLSSNRLTGSIPPELGNLANLQELDLSLNGFLTGGIPPELGGLGNLRTLDLSHNRVGGSIPPEIGNLSKLERLRLKGTQLTGTIPQELVVQHH